MDEERMESVLTTQLKRVLRERVELYNIFIEDLHKELPDARMQDIEVAMRMTCLEADCPPVQVVGVVSLFLKNYKQVRDIVGGTQEAK